jgi:hypothetical protein
MSPGNGDPVASTTMRPRAESSERAPVETQRRIGDPVGRLSAIRLGGAEGNEILTCAIAIALTALLVLEGATVVDIAGLAHRRRPVADRATSPGRGRSSPLAGEVSWRSMPSHQNRLP